MVIVVPAVFGTVGVGIISEIIHIHLTTEPYKLLHYVLSIITIRWNVIRIGVIISSTSTNCHLVGNIEATIQIEVLLNKFCVGNHTFLLTVSI